MEERSAPGNVGRIAIGSLAGSPSPVLPTAACVEITNCPIVQERAEECSAFYIQRTKFRTWNHSQPVGRLILHYTWRKISADVITNKPIRLG